MTSTCVWDNAGPVGFELLCTYAQLPSTLGAPSTYQRCSLGFLLYIQYTYTPTPSSMPLHYSSTTRNPSQVYADMSFARLGTDNAKHAMARQYSGNNPKAPRTSSLVWFLLGPRSSYIGTPLKPIVYTV